MSIPSDNLIVGSFTSDGVSETIDLNPLHNIASVDLLNITQFGSAAGTTPVITAHWELGMAANSVITGLKTNGAATIQIPAMNTTQGVSVQNTSDQTPGPLVATGTAVSAASPAVVSDASTGTLIANTTVVRMLNTTGMLQIAGMDFTVGTINAGVSFQLRYLAAAGFAAPATNADWRIIPFNPQFYPRRRYVTAITQATSAVITLSVAHDFTVGEQVRIFNPDYANFGMAQIHQQLGTITAIATGATNTITVDIDSSAYSAWAFPTSAVAAAGITFAQVVPVGDEAVLTGSTQNLSSRRILLGTNAIGGANDVMRYRIKTY